MLIAAKIKVLILPAFYRTGAGEVDCAPRYSSHTNAEGDIPTSYNTEAGRVRIAPALAQLTAHQGIHPIPMPKATYQHQITPRQDGFGRFLFEMWRV